MAWTKEKQKAYRKEWTARNRDHVRSANRAWCQANPEKNKASHAKWREKKRDYIRTYYAKHRERLNASAVRSAKKYKEKYRPVKRATFRRWYYRNQPQAVARTKAWQIANPERAAANAMAAAHRRRARKKQVGGSFTAAEFKALCSKYGNACLCCGRSDVKMQPDHVIPLSREGSNDISNIQPLCRKCNRSKGTRTKDYRLQTLKTILAPQMRLPLFSSTPG